MIRRKVDNRLYLTCELNILQIKWNYIGWESNSKGWANSINLAIWIYNEQIKCNECIKSSENSKLYFMTYEDIKWIAILTILNWIFHSVYFLSSSTILFGSALRVSWFRGVGSNQRMISEYLAFNIVQLIILCNDLLRFFCLSFFIVLFFFCCLIVFLFFFSFEKLENYWYSINDLKSPAKKTIFVNITFLYIYLLNPFIMSRNLYTVNFKSENK